MSDINRFSQCLNKANQFGAFIRFWRNSAGMLSGVSTQTGNAVGTGLNVWANPFRTATAAVVDPLTRRAAGAEGRQVHFEEAAAEAYAWFRSMPDFFKRVGQRARKGVRARVPGEEEGVGMMGALPQGLGTGGREIDEIYKNAPGSEGLKKIIGFPMRLMGAIDQFFYDRAFNGSVWRQAVRQSKKTGRAVRDIMNDQTTLMRQIDAIEDKIDVFRGMRFEKKAFTNAQKAEWRRLANQAKELYKKSFVEEASLNAEKQIFTSREFERLDGVMDGIDKAAQNNPLIDAIFPFRRTPANIVREILRGSPIGLAGGLHRAFKAKAAQAAGEGLTNEQIAVRLADDIGQAVAGTAMMYSVIELVDRGVVKLNPYKERARAERVTEEAAGILPDTLVINDYAFPISRLEPFGSLFIAAAKAKEARDAGEDPDPNVLQQIYTATEQLAFSSIGDTFFDPFADFSEALQDDKSWARWVERFGGSFVPRAITQFDQRIREEGSGPIDRLPGQGEAKLGLFGQERGAQTPLLSVLAGRTGKAEDPIAIEMNRVGAYHLPPSGLTTDFKAQLSKRGIGYSDVEDRTLRQAKGRAQRMLVEQIMNSPNYQNLPQTGEGNLLRKQLIDRAFKQASDHINTRAKALKLAKVPLTQQALFK